MGFINQIFGSGANTPASATIVNPVEQSQANASLSGANASQQQQQQLLSALQGQGGLQNQQNVFGQQQGLANQLQQQANGQGPNPAQDMLAQNTGANTANQAALMAGQRGVGDNAGMIARQAANVGAQNQQMQAGQAATMGAQQQLGAQAQLGQQQMNMQGVAGQQIGNQIGVQQQAIGNQQNLYGQQLQGIEAGNSARLGNTGMQNSFNQAQSAANSQLFGGLLGAAGTAAVGGAQKKFDGGEITPQPGHYAHGGTVTEQLMQAHANFKSGGSVPGQAAVAGNSPKNDTVPAMLSPGEIVIPRSVLSSADPAKGAAAFVAAIMAKRGKK